MKCGVLQAAQTLNCAAAVMVMRADLVHTTVSQSAGVDESGIKGDGGLLLYCHVVKSPATSEANRRKAETSVYRFPICVM